MKTVLIAIDWSEFAEKAFDWYVYHLHRKGTKIILAHYIEAEKEKEYKKKEEAMIELQEMYESRLQQMKIEYEWITGTGSSPGEHIIDMVKAYDAEMIIMGARGLGKIQKVILGSVSDYVIRKAKCPVLICRKGTVGSLHSALDDQNYSKTHTD